MAYMPLKKLLRDVLFFSFPPDVAYVVPRLPKPQRNNPDGEELRLEVNRVVSDGNGGWEEKTVVITATENARCYCETMGFDIDQPLNLAEYMRDNPGFASKENWLLDHTGNLICHTEREKQCLNGRKALLLVVFDVGPWLAEQRDEVIANFALNAFASTAQQNQIKGRDGGLATERIITAVHQDRLDSFYERIKRRIPAEIRKRYMK